MGKILNIQGSRISTLIDAKDTIEKLKKPFSLSDFHRQNVRPVSYSWVTQFIKKLAENGILEGGRVPAKNPLGMSKHHEYNLGPNWTDFDLSMEILKNLK